MPARARVIKSDLARIDKLRDKDIDYSDIPEVGEEVFAQSPVAWKRLEPKTRTTPKAARRARPSRRTR
jgi:hypothetical protein